MQKNLKSRIIIYLLLQFSILVYAADSAHLMELKSKFPYGLLGDDYGILNLSDLALNACRIKPTPLVPGNTHLYEYWICFESKSILPTCDDEGFVYEDGHVGRVNVEAHNQEMVYQFFESRPWPIKDCRNFVKALKHIIKGTLHTCISAQYISKEKKNEQGQMERLASFRRLKTLKGCEGSECVLTKKFKSEYCPELKL